MATHMTSLQRVLTTLGHQEPDRVPFFLFATLHGAKELGLSIEEYFSRPENVVEGQLRLRSKYRADSVSAFFYAGLEMEAWGAETIFAEDGPPNAGAPPIRNLADIAKLIPPRIADCAGLCRALEATRQLKARIGDDALIIGVVISPFSLPIMQVGFDRYFNLIYEQPDLLARLLQVNETFCVEWANAQLAAGANAICYFDPVSSTTILPPDLSRRFGFPLMRRTIASLNGPAVLHFASGNCLSLVDDIAQTRVVAVGVSALENLEALKNACRGKFALIGNLNAIEMRHWSREQTETKVKEAITQAGRGGGYILADNHGEIPWQVPDEVLLAVSEAVHRWGRYPLDWVPADAGQ
jgi:uroporphyrinogen decarboxylase